MKKYILPLIVFIALVGSSDAAFNRMDFCAGLPAGDTVEVYVYDMDDAAVDRNWTSTSVTEKANGDGNSTYWFTVSVDEAHSYDVKCRTTVASPQRIVGFGITKLETSIDALISTRLATTGYTTPPTVTAIRQEMDSNSTKLANVDATITSRAPASTALSTATWTPTKAGYIDAAITSRPSAAAISTQVWTEAIPGTFGAGSAGAKLNSAAAAGDPWETALPGAYGSGTAGYILGTNLNATVSSRLATAGYTTPDNASITAIKAKTDLIPADPATNTQVNTRSSSADMTTLLGRVTALRAGYWDNLSAGAVALDSTVAKEATLNTKVGTALTYTGGRPNVNVAAQDNIDFGALQKISLNAATPSITADVDESAIADAIWDEAIAGHAGAGSTGEKLSQAASAGDPWSTSLPGGYGAGTAGKIIGDYVNASIQTVLTETQSHPTLAEIEASNVLLKATGGSTTNEVGLTADNRVNANATVSLSPEDLQTLATNISNLIEAGATAQEVWEYTERTLSQGGLVALPAMQGQVYTAVAMQNRDVSIVRGDTPRIIFDLGADYTGWTIKFGAKATPSDTVYIISEKDGVWTNAAEGQGYVDLSVAETSATGKLYAEVELRNSDQRLTAIKFVLKIIEDVVD